MAQALQKRFYALRDPAGIPQLLATSRTLCHRHWWKEETGEPFIILNDGDEEVVRRKFEQSGWSTTRVKVLLEDCE